MARSASYFILRFLFYASPLLFAPILRKWKVLFPVTLPIEPLLYLDGTEYQAREKCQIITAQEDGFRMDFCEDLRVCTL